MSYTTGDGKSLNSQLDTALWIIGNIPSKMERNMLTKEQADSKADYWAKKVGKSVEDLKAMAKVTF